MDQRVTFQPDQSRQPQADELGRQIEELMRGPVKPRPSIIVVGDDDVFAITPANPN